jgi:hypothetical protein
LKRHTYATLAATGCLDTFLELARDASWHYLQRGSRTPRRLTALLPMRSVRVADWGHEVVTEARVNTIDIDVPVWVPQVPGLRGVLASLVTQASQAIDGRDLWPQDLDALQLDDFPRAWTEPYRAQRRPRAELAVSSLNIEELREGAALIGQEAQRFERFREHVIRETAQAMAVPPRFLEGRTRGQEVQGGVTVSGDVDIPADSRVWLEVTNRSHRHSYAPPGAWHGEPPGEREVDASIDLQLHRAQEEMHPERSDRLTRHDAHEVAATTLSSDALGNEALEGLEAEAAVTKPREAALPWDAFLAKTAAVMDNHARLRAEIHALDEEDSDDRRRGQ